MHIELVKYLTEEVSKHTTRIKGRLIKSRHAALQDEGQLNKHTHPRPNQIFITTVNNVR